MGRAICQGCGEPVVAGHRFCGHCGARVEGDDASDPGERRPVTVLFCDVVDSTGLAERLGDEAAHRVLDRFVEIAGGEIERYGGTVDKFLGDGILALIGVPRAHEDHAQRAVLAALGLRRQLSDHWPGELGPAPGTRMGIHSGTVVVGSLGGPRRRDRTAIGDTANVAARLQAAAEPGEIVISDATARRVRGSARLAPLGALALRGRRTPVVAYRLLGVGARRSPLDGVDRRELTPFVGRDTDLDALRDAVAAARDGRGAAVAIAGEPGLGKSRLVLELRRELGGEPITFLEGRCASFGAATPYLPLADIVRANAGIVSDDTPETIAGKMRLALAELGMDADRSAAFALHAIGASTGGALDRLSPEAVRDGVFRTLRDMCMEGARRRPLVIAVEDLHWIDPTSEAFLDGLARELAAAHILLVATHRPGYRAPWADLPWSSALALRPLARTESRRVVRAVMGPAAAETEVEEAILRRGEGNPFFLEELSRGAGGGGSDPWGAADVPETVQGVLMARIDRLDPGPRRVLQTASVLGREFSARVLGAVWRGEGELDHHLAHLRRQGFVYESAEGRGARWVFTHALTQDVAYGALLSDRRRALHRAAAEAYTAMPEEAVEGAEEVLALHCSRAGMHADAVRHLRSVAARSAGRHAHEEAVQALELALHHAGEIGAAAPGEDAAELTLALADSLYFLGRFAQSAERLDAVRDRVGDDDPGRAARYHFARGLVASHTGATDDATSAALDARRLAKAAGDVRTMGKAEFVLCRETFWHSRLGESIEHGARGAALLDEAGDRWWEGQLRLFLNLAFLHAGDLDAALASIRRGHAIGDDLGDVRLQSYAGWNLALVHATRLETERAIAEARRAVEMSPDPLNTAFATGSLGFALVEHGDAAAAVPWLERSTGMLYGFGVLRTAGWMQGYLADARRTLGHLDAARAEGEAALATTRTTGHLWGSGRALAVLGRIALDEKDLAAAKVRLEDARRIFEGFDGRIDLAIVRLDLARVADGLGRPAETAEHLARARAGFAASGAPHWLERIEGAFTPAG